MTTSQTGVPLQAWAMDHQPENRLVRDRVWAQVALVKTPIAGILARSREEFFEIHDSIKMISSHTSKSVLLPVFRVELADGTAFTMRDNFEDWKVSVSSPRDIEADFMGLFDPSERIEVTSCEGFPRELVYGPYAENKRQFTFWLPSDEYRIFTFFWIFAYEVLGIRKKG